MATIIEALRGAITKDLSRSLKKSTEQFVKDLFLVTIGVRVAFLIDYASIEISKLRTFVVSLGKEFTHLAAIEIDDFVFIVNKDVFVRQFEMDRNSNYGGSIFVDIDKNRPAQAADEELRNKVSTALTKHLHTIQSTLEKNLAKPILNLDCGIFIITISGWLLEYSCVYFHGGLYRTNKAEDWGNNLSMIPLSLYTVNIESTGIDIAHASQSDGSKLIGVSNDHNVVPVLSFTVPESVEDALKDKFRIEHVLQERFSSRISDISCLTVVSVMKQQVTLPHVLL